MEHPHSREPHAGAHAERSPDTGHGAHGTSHKPYLGLLISLAASYAAMYMIMYSMGDRWNNVYFNLSNVYMTGLMAGSMLPIMLLTMRGMFKNTRVNIALWGASVLVLGGCWFLLRAEAGVGDRQFMRAMIPHHSAAIQMAKRSDISDPRVRALTEEIISSQEREIAQMKGMLAEKK